MKYAILKRLDALEKGNVKEIQCMVFINETSDNSTFNITENMYSGQKSIKRREFEIKANSAKEAAEIYENTELPKECDNKDLLIFMMDYGREEAELVIKYVISKMTTDELHKLLKYLENEDDTEADTVFSNSYKRHSQEIFEKLMISQNPCSVDMLRELIEEEIFKKKG